MKRIVTILCAFLAHLTAPGPTRAADDEVDVIVVGAGIAGLSAALEIGRGGARVLVLDMNSVGGGHAVMAGGFAFAGTPVQEAKGITDSPESAFNDWMAWGETNDPYWTRVYAENSRPMVYDWLTDLGVEFRVLIPTPENSVGRFHFTRGKAVHAVLPILREALSLKNIQFAWNTEVTSLLVEEGSVRGVEARNLRLNEASTYKADAVLISTGGYQTNMELVRGRWSSDAPLPERILVGSGRFAKGAGHRLAEQAGAAMNNDGRYVTFINGVPNPREPERALVTSNDNALWVNAQGRRFTNEGAADKYALPAVLAQEPASYWAVFDAKGAKSFRVRDTLWLNSETIQREILDNETLTAKAGDLETLAQRAGLPREVLAETVARYNRALNQGVDLDFERFSLESRRLPKRIDEAPFYAVRLYPVTRKNLGGIAIDHGGRVLNQAGEVIRGLFAAGEVTGVAGINGSHGMSGTFLGPSVLTGRIAGQSVIAALKALAAWSPAVLEKEPVEPENLGSWEAPFDAEALRLFLEDPRDGYWHFETAHNFVLEKEKVCTECHSAQMPMGEALSKAQFLAQTQVCTNCH